MCMCVCVCLFVCVYTQNTQLSYPVTTTLTPPPLPPYHLTTLPLLPLPLQVSETVKNIHDLWALPLLIIIAFILLYYQLNIAFISGVVVIVIMIPINTYIASVIQSATGKCSVV